MTRFGTNLIKILIASLICGLLLGQIGITAEKILEEMGVNMQRVDQVIAAVLRYLLPPLVTGAIIVVPIWLATTLFTPPKG